MDAAGVAAPRLGTPARWNRASAREYTPGPTYSRHLLPASHVRPPGLSWKSNRRGHGSRTGTGEQPPDDRTGIQTSAWAGPRGAVLPFSAARVAASARARADRDITLAL